MPKSMPFRNGFKVKYPFGVIDLSYKAGRHCGVDLIPLVTTDPVVPINTGPIVAITTNDDYGNHVVQRLPEGLFAYYNHLARINVKIGQALTSGITAVGPYGSTGRSTGPHLDIRISKYPYHTSNFADFISVPEYLGFANTDELIVRSIESEENEVIKHLVICNQGPDERAAAYLGDYLKAPVCLKGNLSQDIIESAEHIHQVGIKDLVSNKAVAIVGLDRFDTCRKVIDICQGK